MRGLYGVYVERLEDPQGRSLLQAYLRAEEDRGRRVARYLADRGVAASASLLALFAGLGRIYGRVTARLGTRIMMRIALSASGRASRAACAALGAEATPDLVYFATLRARNEGDLLDALRQHLIDSRARK
ncbi:MAG: hypothetical protein DMF50_03935 [Acidobacteria bacterium]|nr:MAG: hypothetical protein DMF50_03935 [Acidobacteriota bacterium]